MTASASVAADRFFFRFFRHHFFGFDMSKVGFGFGYDDTGQADECDEVRNSHEAVYDVRQDPDDVQFQEGTAGDEDDEHDTVWHNALDTDQIFHAAFAVVIPAKDSRKGKERQADAEDETAIGRESLQEGCIGQSRPVDITHPGTAHDEDQPR